MMHLDHLPGAPTPLAAGTHEWTAPLPKPIPFDPAAAGVPELAVAAPDPFDVQDEPGLPAWLVASVRMIRPICVGALLAIPTIGAASVGLVALVSHQAAMHAVEASTAFLAGIPGDIVLLIGALATGYSVAKTVERIKGVRA